MRQHIPRVRIMVPEPDRHGMIPVIFIRIEIDGEEWAITDYAVKGNVDGIQTVTLTILADVTIERSR